jgi:poly-gamma-glutamate synthesis protein (capsule biosynthesis protein)
MDFPLSRVALWLRAADLAVGNYEGVIAADGVGAQQSGGYRLRATPEAAAALARAGFDLIGLANNHTMDWGTAGLQATVENLRSAGLSTVGAGPDAASAHRPQVTTVRGVRIVWLSYTMVSDPPENSDSDQGWMRSWLQIVSVYDMASVRQQLAEQVRAARALGDVLIVQFHWGYEYTPYPLTWQVKLAHTAIDAGAALVVGHHPHVVQSYETYRGGLIVYSLGNFLFDQDWNPGLALWIRLVKHGVIDVHGLTLRPGVYPDWQSPAGAAAALRDRCWPGAVRAFTLDFVDGRYTLSPRQEDTPSDDLPMSVTPPSRHIGEVDLEGDGELEQVGIQDGRLRIVKSQREVYLSLAEWQVVDAAVGDPNQDGRFEVVMLLWRQEAPGARVMTQPFVVGYRRGEYRVLWGGSQPPAWIQAVGIADGDGDGLDEFLTIERDRDASLCEARYRVVVTHWNGWGFTRLWESDYGLFTALTLVKPS